jgi:uncharacterized protein YceK
LVLLMIGLLVSGCSKHRLKVKPKDVDAVEFKCEWVF